MESLLELETLAREKLHPHAFDYYVSGAADEVTLRANRAAFERVAIHHRVLVDVSARTPKATVLGHEIAMPVLLAPTAFHKLAHPDGEIATARAASNAKTIMVLSSLSTTDVEDVAKEAMPLFFQLYVYRDRKATEDLVRRVEAAGCAALFVTVDAPLLGRRERDVKNRFTLPDGLTVKNLLPAGYGEVASLRGDSGLAEYFERLIDPAFSFADLAWLQKLTRLPIVLKGIVRADDARRARDAGVSGIVVSNHGGRQLDSSPATLDALPRVIDAVGNDLEVLMDGGVRRGTDVIKAIAYGARAVMIGRPILWALAVGGQSGVEQALSTLRAEIDLGMALSGCATVASMTRDLVEP